MNYKSKSLSTAASLVPPLMAAFTFLSGLVLLFSGSVPSDTGRLNSLKNFISLPFLEFSHFTGSLIGLFLLVLARGIQKRINLAYYLTVFLLGFGIVTSLLKGFQFEEALFLSAILVFLIPSKRHFYRKASLTADRLNFAWFLSLFAAFGGFLLLGLWCHRHVEYSDELWWRFGFDASAPRFLRAGIGGVLFLTVLAMSRLLGSARPKTILVSRYELDRMYSLVRESKKCESYRALCGDKSFLFSPSGKTFLMYRAMPKTFVALGDPVGPEEEWKDLILDFRGMADLYDANPVFWETSDETLHFYLDAGLSTVKIGEKARVRLSAFSFEESGHGDFRHAIRHMEKNGATFEIIPQNNVPGILEELKEISDAWLKGKNTREKGFSLGFFDPDYLKYCDQAVLRQNGQIVAFANLWMGAEKEEFSPDLVRYDPKKAPKEAMDYILLKLIQWGKDSGYRWFSLGVAPLAGMDNRAFSPLWSRLSSILLRRSKYFYNFEGLRQYKQKFEPEWTPVYLVTPGRLSVPQAMTDIAILSSGSFKGIFLK